MTTSLLYFSSNETPSSRKGIIDPETKKVSDDAQSFFNKSYSFSTTQAEVYNLFPAKGSEDQIQYVSNNTLDIQKNSDKNDRIDDLVA